MQTPGSSSNVSSNVSSNEDRDAVCFTSGPSGAPFSAGFIHAWLAAGRKAPLAAAGISMGAISAAAMQRVFEEMNAAPTHLKEQKRWEWYRRYLDAVTQNPLSAIWNAVPDPVDFFGKLPPVEDLSVPPALRYEAESGRRHYYLLTRLGVWLAHLPIRLNTIATFTVMHVRRREGYGGRLQSGLLFWWNGLKLAVGLCWHILRRPTFIRESSFKTNDEDKSPHPLFGWPLWLFVLALCIVAPLLCCLAIAVAVWAFVGISNLLHSPHGLFKALLLGAGLYLLAKLLERGLAYLTAGMHLAEKLDVMVGNLARDHVFAPLDIMEGLLSPYEVRRQLYDLFSGAPTSTVGTDDVHRLIVCAALESAEQVVLREEMDVVSALTAAVSIPGLFAPYDMDARSLLKTPEMGGAKPPQRRYRLVDGAAVRTNPLPAFFDWCKEPGNRDLAIALEDVSKHRPALHVVYNVPISYPGDISKAPAMKCPDIVESARQALQLEKRRDTRQEVRQTNYMSRLEKVRRKALGQQEPGERGPFIIRTDEIAPTRELDTGNALSPRPDKLLQIVALGCKAALETLYSSELLPQGGRVDCKAFLQQKSTLTGVAVPGLPEVCSCCVGVLEANSEAKQNAPPLGLTPSYGKPQNAPIDLAHEFQHLTGPKPKVVFLGSGGVFRGAFHIGVIAAMVELKLYPDLVVGASVGALMGGALCNMTAGSEANEREVLTHLASVFINVDRTVALTRTLKNAAKQLGTRARSIALSPSQLTRMVDRGSRSDAGFAATGSPPALIDALSSLFMVPRRRTAYISSEFVAGHFSGAFASFLKELREETLASFDIQEAVIGVSMLADCARTLLGDGASGIQLSSTQPYQQTGARNKVAFFSTTSYLNAQTPLLLGRDFLTPNPTWDGLYAGLSSSAFPAAFAARRESDVLPGVGSRGRFFADGGLFDNLPFFPAIEILSAVQAAVAKDPPPGQTVTDRLHQRTVAPNIFIAAGLNAEPDFDADCKTLFEIKARASSLSVNSKTQAFSYASDKVTKGLSEIAAAPSLAALTPEEISFLDRAVTATVISIVPADEKHLNPTFAFCKATGLKKTTVQTSIADGCFQSLRAFKQYSDLLKPTQAIPVTLRPRDPTGKRHSSKEGLCPYFHKDDKTFACPFSKPQKADITDQLEDVRGVYTRCVEDEAHHALLP